MSDYTRGLALCPWCEHSAPTFGGQYDEHWRDPDNVCCGIGRPVKDAADAAAVVAEKRRSRGLEAARTLSTADLRAVLAERGER